VTKVTRVPSSLQRWFPASMLVAVLLGGTAAAQRIGLPWGNLVVGLLSLTGLLLSCIVAVVTMNLLLRLSSRCYREWAYRPAAGSSKEVPSSASAAASPRRRASVAVKVTRPSSIWRSMRDVVRAITTSLGDTDDAALDDAPLDTSSTDQAPVAPSTPQDDPIYDRFADKAA
jgi:hypothetical protein